MRCKGNSKTKKKRRDNGIRFFGCREPIPEPLQKSPHNLLNFKVRFRATKAHFLLILFFVSYLLLHHFFLSIDIGTAPRMTLPLYNDHEWRTQGNSLHLTILSIFFLTCLTLKLSIITLLFFSRFDRIAMYIGFLAPGMDGYAFRLEFGRKGLQETLGSPHNSF
jgi:hypothetical protein